MLGLSQAAFQPDVDIPDLANKVVLVTGGNIGLGYESVYQLSKHNPKIIYLAARSKEKADAAIARIKEDVPAANISHLPLDLSSFQSISLAVKEFNGNSDRLDILMNNAGIMACPAGTTSEGYEVQLGVNHLGHALLTKLLLPTLLKTASESGADVRIINVSSEAHNMAPKGGVLLSDAKSPMPSISTWQRYGQSKLANILYTQELARRYTSIKSVSIHPGVVNTNLFAGTQLPSAFKSMFSVIKPLVTVSAKTGALNQLWASFSPSVETGRYYVPVGKPKPGAASLQVRNEKLAKDLWDWTEKQLADHGY